MNFAQAYKEMRSGKKITNVRFHGGYWVWENGTIMIHCADGTVLDIRDTPDTAYTFDFIVADGWSYITEKEKPKIIFVVSCYKNGETPIVTVYDNEDAAVKHYDAALTFGRYNKVDMEECPIYESFTMNEYVMNLTFDARAK